MQNKPVSKMFTTIFLTLLIVGGVVLLLIFVILPRLRDIPALDRIRMSTHLVDFHTHFSLDETIPQLVLDGQRLRDVEPPLVEYRGGVPRVYLRADFLREYIDPFVFWDDGAGALFISTLYDMLEFQPGSEFFLINGSPQPLDNNIRQIDGEIFLPISLVHSLYAVIVEYHPQYNMVVVISADELQSTAFVGADRADIHYWPGSRPVTAQLSRGEMLTLFADHLPEDDYPAEAWEHMHDFVRVRTEHGLLGYVEISNIENLQFVTPADYLNRNLILEDFIFNNTHHPQVWQGGAVNLTWEYARYPASNAYNMTTPLDESVNVVSPTWFRIDENGTHLNSVASREYVDWAHGQGVYVWPLVFDVWYTRSRLFLMNRDARRYAVNQLVEYVETFGLDGINIDFEHLRAEDGPYKIQFLRELAIPLRQRGVVLSAAVKVPIPATAFYRRDLIAKTVDFVMIMAYDEHWATHDVAGPNASLPWVRSGVENMLSDGPIEGAVPAERLILGLPFYNRIWREVVATGEVNHYAARGTNVTRSFFEDRDVFSGWVWDAEIGSYFGEVSAFEGGETVIFRVWLEDARSIREKMRIYTENNLAGVASWSRMFAIDEFWEVLRMYF